MDQPNPEDGLGSVSARRAFNNTLKSTPSYQGTPNYVQVLI
jgi:hypothetical protein